MRSLRIFGFLMLLWSVLSACRPQAESEHAGHSTVATASVGHSGHTPASPQVSPTANGAAKVAGRSGVMISPQKQQLIGLQTVRVTPRVLSQVIRTVGRVEYDERALAHVHTKVEGWVEKLYADFTGQWVSKGQPLLEIYSPELLTAQKEYLLALQTQRQLRNIAKASERDFSAEDNASLVAAVRQKLLLWDLQPAQIAALERTGIVRKTVTLYAPTSGYVIEKKALTGMQVMPGMELYTLANLSNVWVHAQVYEYELPKVKTGQLARMRLAYLPGVSFSGRVSYIYPTLDPETRTAIVRIVFANPQNRLKPEMHTEVSIETGTGRQELAIPADAVIDSGTRKLIFITRGDGYFEPREIVTGGRVGDYYPVIKGLKPNELVVSSANFLVDSESQLKAAAGNMGGHGH